MPLVDFGTFLNLGTLVPLHPTSRIAMAPKKRLKSTAASCSPDQVTRGNSSIAYMLNKYNLIFVDAVHTSYCDAIVSRKIYAANYLDVEILTTLHLYDDLRLL